MKVLKIILMMFGLTLALHGLQVANSVFIEFGFGVAIFFKLDEIS